MLTAFNWGLVVKIKIMDHDGI